VRRLASALAVVALLVGAARAQTQRPNVLFAIADDWSFGHAGSYGCDWVRTPAFDRVAREGLLFERAFTPNAKCAPSRAILLAGRHSWQLEEAANHVCEFPPKFGGWVEALEALGYRTGYTGKGWGPGRALDESGTPRRITGARWSELRAEAPASGIAATDYAADFEAFLDANDDERPWVFWYGALEPHRGYELGSGEARGKALGDVDRVPAYWPDVPAVRRDIAGPRRNLGPACARSRA